MALSVTALVFVGIRFASENDDFGPAFSLEDQAGDPLRQGAGASVDDMRTLIGGLLEGAQLRSVSDPGEAVALAVDIGRRLQELAPPEEVEEILSSLIPDEVVDVDGGEILARAMAQLSSAPADEAVADTADMRLAEAIEVAGDTIGELEQGLAQANRDLEVTRAELDEALQQGGLIGWFTSRIDSLGFGLGWWTLDFAILMPWMDGQTPGKRAMGVRVVRLDGRSPGGTLSSARVDTLPAWRPAPWAFCRSTGTRIGRRSTTRWPEPSSSGTASPRCPETGSGWSRIAPRTQAERRQPRLPA